jgi:aromatic ring-cleaving dioxygenase
LKRLTDRLKTELKIEAIQIHIHRDEGKSRTELNHHAHIVFDWQDKEKGTTIKFNKQGLSEMQNIVSEVLDMERGVTSDKKHLKSLQFKNQQESEKLSVLMAKTAGLENNIKELRTAFEIERNDYVQKVHEFNRTKEHYEAEIKSFKKSLEPLKIEAQNEAKKIIEDAKKAVDSVDVRIAEAINQKFNRSPTFYMDPQKIIKEMPKIKIDTPEPKTNFLGAVPKDEHDRVVKGILEQVQKGLDNYKKVFTLQIIDASEIVGKELQQIADYRYAENAKKEWAMRNERLLQEARNQGINKEKGKGNEMGR